MTAPPSSSPAVRPAASSPPPPARPPGGVRAPRSGRSSRAVLALLLIVAGAAIGAALYLTGDSRTQVVVAARDIPTGTLLSADDLSLAEISGTGVSAIAAVDASRLLGQTATTTIPAGALLHADMVDPAPPPGDGKVAVGLALTAGQLPVAELAPDRLVEVLQTPAASEAAVENAMSTVLVDEALVLSVSADASGAWLVTVAVDRADAPAVAAAAAAGRATLGLLPLATGIDFPDESAATGSAGTGSPDSDGEG